MEPLLLLEFGAWRLAWPLALFLLLLPFLPLLFRRGEGAEAKSDSTDSIRLAMTNASNSLGAIRLPFAPCLPHAAAPKRARHAGAAARSDLVGGLIFVLLVLAAARPQWIDEADRRPASGRDLLILLDVSASMKTADLKTEQGKLSRLAVAARFGRAFLDRRPGDRAGLIVFASRPYLYVPMSYDLAAVGSALEAAAPGLAGEKTALGDALALAVKTLTGDSGRPAPAGAVAVLISDGANTAGELTPEQAAWIAAQRQVRVHALMVGGAPEIDVLRAIAEQTGGSYARATDSRAVGEFFARIDQLEALARDDTPAGARPHELYPLPLLAALLVLALTRVLGVGMTAWRRRRPDLAGGRGA